MVFRRPALNDPRARRLVVSLAWLTCVAVLSATLLYAYPQTLGRWTGLLGWVHAISGDLAFLLSGAYLIVHLRRVWRMRWQVVSRYSGVAVVGVWWIAALSGIYGQLEPLDGWPLAVHLVSSVAIIVVVCFHGAWAYRPRPADDPVERS